MKYPHRLARARIDRGPGPYEIVTNFKELDTEMGHRRIEMDGSQRINRHRSLPDRAHVLSLARRIIVATSYIFSLNLRNSAFLAGSGRETSLRLDAPPYAFNRYSTP